MTASTTPSLPSSPASSSGMTRQTLVLGILIALFGAILFSTKAIVAKLLYRYHLDAVTVIAFRMLFSMPFFAAMAWWQSRRGPPLSKADRWRIVGLGFAGYYLSSFLDFLGLQFITAGLERLILFLTPSFVLLISSKLLHKRISKGEWLALLTSYAGIVLVFVHDLHQGGSNVVLGAMLVLGAALAYAAYLILSGELVNRIGSLRLVSYAMCVSSVCCIGQFLLLRPLGTLIQPLPVYGLSLVNAVFCTIFPVIMTMVAVKRIGASTASQAGMIGPVSTLFLGAWLLGEPITGWQLAGTALVLCGIYLLTQKRL